MTSRKNHNNKHNNKHNSPENKTHYTSMPTNNNSQEQEHQIEKDVKPILTSTIKPIAYESATFEHLKKFNSLNKYINQFLPNFIISWLIISLEKFNLIINYCFNSNLIPLILKKIYNSLIIKLMSLDNLINILVLDQGIIAFNSNLIKQNNKIGIWCLYFTLDYIANCFNILLQKLIIIPLNLNNSIKDKQDDNIESNLPHLNELSSTTKSLKKDLQDKVNIDYIQPTKLKANKLIVEPTQNAYKSVSETYETHLNKENNNVPRALYSTGRDLGNTTLKKFNVLVQSQSKEDVDQLKTN